MQNRRIEMEEMSFKELVDYINNLPKEEEFIVSVFFNEENKNE